MDGKSAKLAKRIAQWVVALAAIATIVFCGWQVRRQIANWKPLGPASPAVVMTVNEMTVNEFDLSKATIPVKQILTGGPPKDGIPALTLPEFVEGADADFMQSNDPMIGVAIDGDARAYPLKILDSHEIVNDTVGQTPIAITYCPLCDSSVVFDRRIDGATRELGVSGKLYNSNVLMYDRQTSKTESLLSQMMAEGVTGPLASTPLRRLPLEVTTWQSWRKRHPDSKVLSINTGHERSYDRTLYADYFAAPRLMRPVTPTDDRMPAKTRVLGVATKGATRAYPIDAFLAEKVDRLEQQLEGKSFALVADREAKGVRVEEADGQIEWVYSFWFSWYSMNPKTELWVSD